MSEIVWPLLINKIRGGSVNNTFGMVRKFADGTPRPHQGWDFSAEVGTSIHAIADGEIVKVRNVGDYGQQLFLKFQYKNQTLYAFYAHLSQVFKEKGPVNAFDIIGATGKTGNASNLPVAEDHLHFEIRTKIDAGFGLDNRLSPIKVFGECPLHTAITGGKG